MAYDEERLAHVCVEMPATGEPSKLLLFVARQMHHVSDDFVLTGEDGRKWRYDKVVDDGEAPPRHLGKRAMTEICSCETEHCWADADSPKRANCGVCSSLDGESPCPAACSACDGDETNELRCVASQRPCGHHCNCVMIHDTCHWCHEEFGEEEGEI